MARKRFPSKIDAWLAVLMVMSLVLVTAGFVSVIYASRDVLPILAVLFAMLLLYFLIGSTFLRTHYTIDGNTLHVVSGPFHWKVPIDQITSVETTRSPLSSPALSLDRLRIRYAGNRSIMISPADKKRFLKALGVEVTG